MLRHNRAASHKAFRCQIQYITILSRRPKSGTDSCKASSELHLEWICEVLFRAIFSVTLLEMEAGFDYDSHRLVYLLTFLMNRYRTDRH
jgi:hypothetical protein